VDRRNHEFFHQRDYPDPNVLESIFQALGETPQPLPRLRDTLRDRLKIEDEVFDRAVEKLWIHGGARIGADEDAARGETGWRPSYLGQREHKLGQLDQMARFAEAHGCRMLHLVRHFGDREDSGEPCGTCDVCAPQECEVRRFRGPSGEEQDILSRVMELLRRRNGASTGQIFRDISEEGVPGGFDRKAFERLLGGLHRAGLIRLADEQFEKDGKQISFRRATLTAEGYRGGPEAAAEVRLSEEELPVGRTRSKAKEKKKAATKPLSLGTAGRAGRAATVQSGESMDGDEPLPGLVDALKTWRRTEAKRRGVPAFRILTDRTLVALASARPGDEEGLLSVPGIGPGIATKYGQEILSLLREG
jgi:DNA topoisomerase-3